MCDCARCVCYGCSDDHFVGLGGWCSDTSKASNRVLGVAVWLVTRATSFKSLRFVDDASCSNYSESWQSVKDGAQWSSRASLAGCFVNYDSRLTSRTQKVAPLSVTLSRFLFPLFAVHVVRFDGLRQRCPSVDDGVASESTGKVLQ